jgi:DNA-binding MarR family transcriptional regulator
LADFPEASMQDSEQPGSDKRRRKRTVTLSEKDLRDAARLFELLVDPATLRAAFTGLPPGGSQGLSHDRQQLHARARRELEGRRVREHYFDRQLFGEPAWEILLALYVNQDSGARLTTSKLAESVALPMSTVIRWLGALEQGGLVGRGDHPTDRRKVFIRLLDKGRQALDAYFGSMPD